MATGLDSISSEMMKASIDIFLTIYDKLFNLILRKELFLNPGMKVI